MAASPQSQPTRGKDHISLTWVASLSIGGVLFGSHLLVFFPGFFENSVAGPPIPTKSSPLPATLSVHPGVAPLFPGDPPACRHTLIPFPRRFRDTRQEQTRRLVYSGTHARETGRCFDRSRSCRKAARVLAG